MGTAVKPTRANRTLTVACQHETTYLPRLGEGQAFVEGVLAFLLALGVQLQHTVTLRRPGRPLCPRPR